MVDTPQTLAAAMLRAAAEAAIGARIQTELSARRVRDQAKRNVQKSAPVHNAHAQDAITYEINYNASGTSAQIGYDQSIRGGPLGPLLEYGGGGDKSPPHRDIGRALDAEEEKYGTSLERLPGITL